MAVGAQSAHKPRLEGATVDAHAHVGDVMAGFTRAYRALMAGRHDLIGPHGLLDDLARRPVRFVFRDTNLYASLLERTLHPDYLKNGAERGVQLDILARTLLPFDTRPSIWPIVDAEVQALEEMDVPLFSVEGGSRHLVLPSGQVIEDCFRASPYEEVVRRIGSLTDEDLAAQVHLIDSTFAASAARGLRIGAGRQNGHAASTETDVDPADAARLDARALACAQSVADRLCARALHGHGEISWMTIGYLPAVRRHQLGAATASMFDGYLGLAFFLAAVEHVSGGVGLADPALKAIAPLRHRLDELAHVVRQRTSCEIGVGIGLGSAVYALTHMATWLGRPELLVDARRVATLLDGTRVTSGRTHDILSGRAGALVALLTLYARTADEALVAQATAIGDSLMQARHLDEASGLRVWRSADGRVETGFAHGQSGIAYALRRLDAVVADDRFVQAAEEAMTFERQILGTDLSGAADDTIHAAWSHGAAGIGLARLGPARSQRSPAVTADLDSALRLTYTHLHDGVTSLCCGTAARIDVLVTMARTLGRPDLMCEARCAATGLLSTVEVEDELSTGWPNAAHLGLFHGAAGVAYELLRVTNPHDCPSVLLWEA
jgi:type 2 lantibiotic biosynthesis protein LanM